VSAWRMAFHGHIAPVAILSGVARISVREPTGRSRPRAEIGREGAHLALQLRETTDVVHPALLIGRCAGVRPDDLAS